MRYKQLTVYLVFGITILLFASSITASSSSFLYAQQQITQNATPTTSATSAIGVKITSPARGQQVPVGSLTISGTSKDNTNSNDCTVYAIWDHLKPYQKVEPTGPGGSDDYSNWTFTYNSAYHLITNGTNQLTAKISCLASSLSSSTTAVSSSSSTNLTKWYSINVTGIISKVNQTKTPVPVATIATTTNNTNTNSTNTTSSATASTPSTTPSLLPFPVRKVNLNNNNDDDNGDQSGDPGKQDKKSSSSSDKQSSNENDNNKKKASNNHDDNNEHNDSKNDKKHKSSNNNNKNNDDSKTDNSSSKPHKKHDNSKSKTTTHHHDDDHSKKNTKHIIKEKTKEVKHKIKHLKKQINKKISKHI